MHPWETAYIPSLLNNCQTWIEISDTTVNKLEKLQNYVECPPNYPQSCTDIGEGGIDDEMEDSGKKADLHELHPTFRSWITCKTDTDDPRPRKASMPDSGSKAASGNLEAPKPFR